MIICPTCNCAFKTEQAIQKHFLSCWKQHNPNHQSKPAPCKGNIIKIEMSEEINNFFNSFRKDQYARNKN